MEKSESSELKHTKVKWFHLRPFVIIVLIFIVAVAIFSNWYFPRKSEANRLKTIAIGDEIVNALEAYRLEHGQYPSSLEMLVPKYLDKIKSPPWGNSGWQYMGSPIGLTVGYKSHGGLYPNMSYHSKHGWIHDT